MKHSHMIITSCIILSTFLIAGTNLGSQSPVSGLTSSGFNILQRSPRRALRAIPTHEQHNATAKDSEDKQHHPIDNAVYKREPPMEIADDIVDKEELVYHTDYHGVTTHPAPNPKHPGHSK